MLGAGGAVGGAFHAGVLSALADAGVWDARRAETIVGTSAGSVTAALIRLGLPPTDIASRAEGRPMTDEGVEVVRRTGLTVVAPAAGQGRPGLRLGRPAGPGALVRAVTRPWDLRVGSLAAALLPAGTVPNDFIARSFDSAYRDGWPHEALWICAVRLSDGQRVVFGRDDVGARVGDAVAASCAIPGYFQPVTIGGSRYVDGGAHSLTNAGLLAGPGLDVVVVSAPMSLHRSDGRPSPDAALRQAAGLQLRQELRAVRRRGTRVVVFEPTAEDVSVMGVNAMDQQRRPAVVAQVRKSVAGRLAAKPELAQLFA